MPGFHHTFSQSQEQKYLSGIEECKDIILEEKNELEAEILNYDKTDDLRDYLASISKQYWSVECLETFINILENDQADNLKDVIRVIASDSIIVDHCVSWVNP